MVAQTHNQMAKFKTADQLIDNAVQEAVPKKRLFFSTREQDLVTSKNTKRMLQIAKLLQVHESNGAQSTEPKVYKSQIGDQPPDLR